MAVQTQGKRPAGPLQLALESQLCAALGQLEIDRGEYIHALEKLAKCCNPWKEKLCFQ
jgi:hypothetical protein